MMMGRDQAGIDHAATSIEPDFAGLWLERADLDNHAVLDPDLPRGAHRCTGKAGEDPGGVIDQHRAHVSVLVSLSCQFDKASCDSITIAPNSTTPVNVIRKRAA